MPDPNLVLICSTITMLGKYALIGFVVYLVYKWWSE
jgi:hypothetical protein